jgi:hypothetical protein
MPVLPKQKLNEEVHWFEAGDGFRCNLIHVWRPRPATKGPILLAHGAGVRANIFRAPVSVDVVDYLVTEGYDVWLENWRASIDLPFNLWNLDQAALYDHPFAVREIIRETGAKTLKAVVHCQGSTSFCMAAVAGLLPEVDVIVSNAVSLHPVVPFFSSLKIRYLVPCVKPFTDRMNPQWGLAAPGIFPKMIDATVELFHHECQNPVCKEVSFTYGSGFPALWRHENLNDETHEWLKGEFAAVPLTFYTQMNRCVRAGHLVSMGENAELPRDFTVRAPQTLARFSFLAGDQNLCFLPESQARTFEFFEGFRKDYHSLHRFSQYSHLDIFMGQRAAKDVFPVIGMELEKKIS